MTTPNDKRKRLRGLRSLVEDIVEHGSKAVQEVHLATSTRTFTVLEAIPPLAAKAKVVHTLHDLSVSGVYGMIRLVNKAVGKTLEVAIDVAEPEAPPAELRSRARGAARAPSDGDPG